MHWRVVFKFAVSDQSDRCRWNHHCNDAILAHATLVAYVRRSEFTKFEAFWWIKISWIPKVSLKSLSDALYCCEMMMHKWTLGHRQKKKRGGGGITPRLPFHYLILFIPNLITDLHFLDNIRPNFLVKWTGWGIHRDELS